MRIKILIIIFAYWNIFIEWMELLNPIKRKIFNQRLNICKECIYRNKKLEVCSICNCPLKPKSRGDYDIDEEGKSILGCPLKKW